MPVINWNITVIDGKQYLVFDVVKFRVPLEWDPSSNIFIAVAVPDGGYGSFPALVQGDPGVTPDIDTVINRTDLEWDDPTPDFASWTETSPNVYKLNASWRKGEPGADGTAVFDLDDFGTPVFKKIIRVNAAETGFEYQTQLVGDRHFPASINNAPSGNSGYTLCSVSIAAQDFDWRPEPKGGTVITPTGADFRGDIVCRLQVGGTSAETSGNIIGRGVGFSGLNSTGIPTTIWPGPAAGSAADFDLVPAGSSAIVYMRVERQSGAETFTTSNTTTWFQVRVHPVP